MLDKLVFKFAHWKWKTFEAPALIQSLRAEGKVKEADALEKIRQEPAPASQDEMVQSSVNKLLAQGRMDEAMKLKEMAQKVKHWQKHGGERPW
jgi:hypothetical protein